MRGSFATHCFFEVAYIIILRELSAVLSKTSVNGGHCTCLSHDYDNLYFLVLVRMFGSNFEHFAIFDCCMSMITKHGFHVDEASCRSMNSYFIVSWP